MVRRERQALPARCPLRRRWSDEDVRRRAVPASQGGLRRAAASRRHLAGVADRLRRAGAVLHARGAALPRPRRAGRGPDRASFERALPASRRVARAADPAARRRPRGSRLPAVPRAVRDHARRVEPAVLDLHPLRDLRRLPVPRPREVGRRGARRAAGARAPERHAPDEREGHEARHERDRAPPSPRWSSSGTGPRSGSRATIVVVACGAANTAKLLLQSASDKHPNGLANGSDQVGRNYMFHDSTAVLALSREENTDRLSEDARRSTTSTSAHGDFEYPLGNVQMVGKSTAPMFRGERPRDTKLAPGVDAGADGAPCDRLLALHGGPPTAGEPRHRGAGRQHQADLHGDEPGSPRSGSTRRSSRCSGSWT